MDFNMKQALSKYSDAAKTLLAALAAILITGGVYDEATVQLLVGAAMACGTTFWQLYGLATKTKPADTVLIEIKEDQSYNVQ